MFSSNSLSEDQKKTIHQWAADGAQINDIQRKIAEEFELKITYMEARFIVLDLNVEILSLEVPVEEEEEVEEIIPTGEVHLSIDSIVRPGLAVSGSVEFSDGEKGLWGIDPNGSFVLDSNTPGYKPSEADLKEFQTILREELEHMRQG